MSFTKEIEKETLPFTCPDCGREFKKSIRWIKSNNNFTCPCGAVIAIDSKHLMDGIRKIEREFASLDKTVEKLSKNLKIKF